MKIQISEDRKNLNGIEYLQKRVTGELPEPSMNVTVPIKITLVEAGRVLMEAIGGGKHLNPANTIHGGFIATVMDSVMAASIRTTLKAGEDLTTIEINVKYLRPALPETKLFAEGRLVNVSRRIGTAEGTLKNDAGELLAFATISCMIFR
ncbi:MAG: PaaI family thioesterase [Leptospirales bacterium]|nr:PaaI family thioesterase [Leptospirales bacterium]